MRTRNDGVTAVQANVANDTAAPPGSHAPTSAKALEGFPTSAPSPREHFFEGVNRRDAELEKVFLVGHDDHTAKATEPVAWVWRDVVARESLVLLGGPPAAGKTTLATFLAVALANPTGKPVSLLGREVTPIPEGKFVVFVEQENGARSFATKLQEACVALGLPVRETLDRIVSLVRSGMRLIEDPRGGEPNRFWGDRLDWMIVWAGRQGRIGALFVDSWATTLPGNANDEDAQAEAAGILRSFVMLTEGPVFALVHTRKDGATSIEDIAGSHQRAAAADVILLAKPASSGGKVFSTHLVFAKLRDSYGDHPEPVDYSIARDDRGQLRIAIGQDADATGDAKERVWNHLCKSDWQTKTNIAEACRMSDQTVQKQIDELKAEDKIELRKTNRRGKETWEFRAKPKEAVATLVPGLFTSANQRGEDDRPF